MELVAAGAIGLSLAFVSLPASPLVDPASPRACDVDADGNGLDDALESELARALVPSIHFDPAENARRPDEPHVVFNAHLIGPLRIRVQYVFLFRNDGGFASRHLCFRSAHPGDTESAIVDVQLWKAGDRIVGRPEYFSMNGERSRTSDPPMVLEAGTHPRIYFSAGKHHQFHAPGEQVHFIGCVDRHREGHVVVPTHIEHLPQFRDVTSPPFATTPLLPDGTWANACDAARFPDDPSKWRSAYPALRKNALDDLGYVGEHVESLTFYGGADGVARKMFGFGAIDLDGDGKPNVWLPKSPHTGLAPPVLATDDAPTDP